MWHCDVPNCGRVAVRVLGDCVLCRQHLCALHVSRDYHQCSKWEEADAYDTAAREVERREISSLLRRINKEALLDRASLLRNGIRCEIATVDYDRNQRALLMGGMNFHLEICFEDGIKWIARFRRSNATSPPPQLRDYILRSEVATLQFLQNTNIPAPKVHGYAIENDENPVGVGYILMDKLPGDSMRWGDASPDQKQWVTRQYLQMMQELQRHPFDAMGSMNVPGSDHVGGLARESTTDFDGAQMRLMGPFTTPEEHFASNVHLILDLILRGQMYSNTPVDAYLIHQELLDMLPKVTSVIRSHNNAKFYLKHADDKGDHILVDEDYNITGIIDWEWAYTAPKAIAFNTPMFLFSVGEFFDGVNTLGKDEESLAQLLEDKGLHDMAGIVRDGKILHRFSFCCGADLENWDSFTGLFSGIMALKVDGDVGDFEWESWRSDALARFQDDEGLKTLLARCSD